MFIRLGGIFTLIMVVLWLYAIFDALTAPAERVRTLPKAIWLLLILLLPPVGVVTWFIWGRPRAQVNARIRQTPFGWQNHGGPRGGGTRPIAPDDDPEFLKRLRDDLRRDDLRRDSPDDDNPAG